MSKEAGLTDLKEGVIVNVRPGHHWEKSDDDVFIEHENEFNTVFENEVNNLLNCEGSLRYLICKETKLEKRQELRKHITMKLKIKKAGKNSEFLLILGTETDMNHYNAWGAYSYYLRFEEIKLSTFS